MRNLVHEVLHEVFEKVFSYVYNQSSDEKQNAPFKSKTFNLKYLLLNSSKNDFF